MGTLFNYYDPANYDSPEALLDKLVEDEFNGTSARTGRYHDESNTNVILKYTVVRPDSRPDLKLEIRYIQEPKEILEIYTEGNFSNRYIYLEPQWLKILQTLKEKK